MAAVNIGKVGMVMESAAERLLRYAAIDTESLADQDQIPSTEKQKDLARLLAEELAALGASDVRTDEHGYVYASIPAAPGCEAAPILGFIAHMDTSPAVSGRDVKPRIEAGYQGGDILLNPEQGIVLSPKEYPSLRDYIGQDLIVTDGTTLLGADDKAGVAEIMAAVETLLRDPSLPHGELRIAFTPDEEVGRGVDCFDIKGFGAEFAYTVDGGALGELEYENFNAATLKLKLHGKSIHPGGSKGQMVNALHLAMEFQSMLPPFERPEFTEGYEGFFHLDELHGTVEEAIAVYIIRDHDRALFEEKKERVRKICAYLNEKYGAPRFEAELTDTYYNMREQVEPHMHLIENARTAMERLGIRPLIQPIRGGTDGCRLSYMGLPCPNLCTGGHNFHGRFEYIPVQSMEKVTALLLEIAGIYARQDGRKAD